MKNYQLKSNLWPQVLHLSGVLFVSLLLGFQTTSLDAQVDPNYYYRLTTQWQGEGKSLDILNDGKKNNQPVLAKTGKYTGQAWKFTPVNNGYYRLTTQWQGEGKSLDIINDGKNNNQPALAKTGRYTGQYWKLTSQGDGYYRLTTKWQGDGKSLDVINDGKNNRLILAKTGSYSGQAWKLTKLYKVNGQSSKGGDMRYPWVNKLNIRTAPDRKAKVVARCEMDEPLVFTGEKSSKKEGVVLRGILFDEPWIKIRTKNNTIGWVHSGAVRKKGEEKGIPLLIQHLVSYTHFGSYDLLEWKKIPNNKRNQDDEGDVTSDIKKYKRGGQTLVVSTFESNYGYGNEQKLLDSTGKVLKERRFNYGYDAQAGDELTETVKDYTKIPAVQYSRKQRFNRPSYEWLQENAKVTMVNGSWKKSTL